jgi:hypothetical protein
MAGYDSVCWYEILHIHMLSKARNLVQLSVLSRVVSGAEIVGEDYCLNHCSTRYQGVHDLKCKDYPTKGFYSNALAKFSSELIYKKKCALAPLGQRFTQFEQLARRSVCLF